MGKKRKKFIKFNEGGNSDPDMFKDASSVEQFIDYVLGFSNPEELGIESEAVYELPKIPQAVIKELNESNRVELKEVERVFPAPRFKEINGEITIPEDKKVEMSSFDEDEKSKINNKAGISFYIDDLRRVHMHDHLLGDIISESFIEFDGSNSIDDDNLMDIMNKMFIALISTRTPRFISNAENVTKGLQDIDFDSSMKMYYPLIAYPILNQFNADTMIFGFDFIKDVYENYVTTIDNLISLYEDMTNDKVVIIFSDLLKQAEQKSFGAILTDEDFDSYKESTSLSGIEVECIASLRMVFGSKEGNSEKVPSGEIVSSELACLYDKYAEIDPIFEMILNPESEDFDKGGVTNDEEPFHENGEEGGEEIEGTGVDETAEPEDLSELEEEKKEVESETIDEEDTSDSEEEDEEIDSIEIEGAEEVDAEEEDGMVIPVTVI